MPLVLLQRVGQNPGRLPGGRDNDEHRIAAAAFIIDREPVGARGAAARARRRRRLVLERSVAHLQRIARRVDRDPGRVCADIDRPRHHPGRGQSRAHRTDAGVHRRRDARVSCARARRAVDRRSSVRRIQERPFRPARRAGSAAPGDRHRVRHRHVLRSLDVVRHVGVERVRRSNGCAPRDQCDGRGLSPSTADRAGRWIFDRDGVLVRTRSRGVERRGAVRGAAEKLRRLLDELRRISDLHRHTDVPAGRRRN